MTTYTLTPVEFEIYDDTTALVARVMMFDAGAATIELKTLHNKTSFDALVPYIQQALSAMQIEGDTCP